MQVAVHGMHSRQQPAGHFWSSLVLWCERDRNERETGLLIYASGVWRSSPLKPWRIQPLTQLQADVMPMRVLSSSQACGRVVTTFATPPTLPMALGARHVFSDVSAPFPDRDHSYTHRSPSSLTASRAAVAQVGVLVEIRAA